MSAIPSPVSVPRRARPFFGSLRSTRGIRLGGVGLLIFTLPIVGLLLFTVLAATGDYRRTIQFDDFWGHGASIERAFSARLRTAANLPSALMVEHGFNPEKPDPAIVRLLIPGAEWERLHGDPQAHWGEWFEAELENGTSLSKAKVRKRGDNSIHWSTPKKSFTLRTQLDATFNGYRTVALSVKDVLPAFVANRMAERAGLFTPHTEISPVFLNNRFYGLFRMIEVIDESFLRKFERLPGNVFRGETAERGEAFKNQPRNLFQNPYIWDLAARNSRAASSGDAGLRALLAGVNSTRIEGHQAMMAVMYREEIARMIALMLVVGDPYHSDEVHNQFWYEDPWSGYLHPVAWDLRLLRLDRPPMQLNSFLRAALRDPLVLDLVLENLQDLVRVHPVLPQADSLVRAVYAKNEPYFEYEYDRAGIIPDVGTPQEVMEILRGNTALLTRWLEDSRVGFQATVLPNGTQVIDWETRGIAGARWTGATLEGVSGDTPAVYADKNLNGQLDGQDSLIRNSTERVGSGVRIKFSEPILLTPGWNTRSKGISAGRQQYRFFVTGVRGPITPLVLNRFTDTDATVEPIAPNAILAPADGWHPWQLIAPAGRTHRLSGTVRLSQSLFISDRDTLDIAPGTNLKLDPEVSVVVYGHLQARGTAAQPIVVEPSVEGRPWGTLALQGHGANGSRIAHLRARGGGGTVIGEVEYTGAVSVQYAHDIKTDHLEVTDNTRSDDAFHAYHATVDLTNCHFRNTIGDAIDYDFADGLISHCRFEQAGNDGIDLMTSNPTIVNNQIYNGGDKGISIGEDSHPLVFNNLISGNIRGIEVKDHSEPVILNNVITGNRVGIRERRKNPRYGAGGWAKVVNSIIQDNRRDIERDEFSRLTLVGSAVGNDSAGTVATPVDVTWLYRRYGIQPDRIAADTVGWQQVPAVMPDTAGFREDFLSVSDGWSATGGVERLEKRRDNLVLEMHNLEAVITRKIDWKVTRPSVAVFELAGRDLESAWVALVSASGEIEFPFQPDPDFTRFQLITVDLPPGHYTGIRIRATAIPGLERLARTTTLLERQNGRLELHRYGRYERPTSSPPEPEVGPK